MSVNQLRYNEIFPEEFSIRHKISNMTEKRTFHCHRQLEIVIALSDNLKCRFEDHLAHIPRYGIILLDQMNLHYMFNSDPSSPCDRYVLYFSSNYISRLSTPEVNLLECFLLSQKRKKYILPIPDGYHAAFLSLLEQMNEFQNSPDPAIPAAFGNLHQISAGTISSSDKPVLLRPIRSCSHCHPQSPFRLSLPDIRLCGKILPRRTEYRGHRQTFRSQQDPALLHLQRSVRHDCQRIHHGIPHHPGQEPPDQQHPLHRTHQPGDRLRQPQLLLPGL